MKTYEELLPIVRDRLNGSSGDHRFRHTLGVVDTALRLAKIYGADLQKTRIAALLHDVTKYDDVRVQRQEIDLDHAADGDAVPVPHLAHTADRVDARRELHEAGRRGDGHDREATPLPDRAR